MVSEYQSTRASSRNSNNSNELIRLAADYIDNDAYSGNHSELAENILASVARRLRQRSEAGPSRDSHGQPTGDEDVPMFLGEEFAGRLVSDVKDSIAAIMHSAARDFRAGNSEASLEKLNRSVSNVTQWQQVDKTNAEEEVIIVPDFRPGSPESGRAVSSVGSHRRYRASSPVGSYLERDRSPEGSHRRGRGASAAQKEGSSRSGRSNQSEITEQRAPSFHRTVVKDRASNRFTDVFVQEPDLEQGLVMYGDKWSILDASDNTDWLYKQDGDNLLMVSNGPHDEQKSVLRYADGQYISKFPRTTAQEEYVIFNVAGDSHAARHTADLPDPIPPPPLENSEAGDYRDSPRIAHVSVETQESGPTKRRNGTTRKSRRASSAFPEDVFERSQGNDFTRDGRFEAPQLPSPLPSEFESYKLSRVPQMHDIRGAPGPYISVRGPALASGRGSHRGDGNWRSENHPTEFGTQRSQMAY